MCSPPYGYIFQGGIEIEGYIAPSVGFLTNNTESSRRGLTKETNIPLNPWETDGLPPLTSWICWRPIC